MINYFEWLYYELRWHRFTRYEKKTYMNLAMTTKRYAGRNTVNAIETNKIIYDAIIDMKPFFAGRIGGNEMNVMAYTYRNRYFPFRTDARKENIHDLCVGAGFFPNDVEMGEKFVNLMAESSKELNLDGVWSRYMEEWFLHTYAPQSEVTWLYNLEPWYFERLSENDVRWTYALKGKRVLVIHPFADTIRQQYDNSRDKLFTNIDSELLPEFELITLKAVQSMGGQCDDFTDWFQAYEYMLSECKKIDFDVAIIGCGAYGFPLGAEIKKMGKVAIHLGGATQLLFGIRGRRWDEYGGLYVNMVNEYWVRPSKDEITSAMKNVERGCYC